MKPVRQTYTRLHIVLLAVFLQHGICVSALAGQSLLSKITSNDMANILTLSPPYRVYDPQEVCNRCPAPQKDHCLKVFGTPAVVTVSDAGQAHPSFCDEMRAFRIADPDEVEERKHPVLIISRCTDGPLGKQQLPQSITLVQKVWTNLYGNTPSNKTQKDAEFVTRVTESRTVALDKKSTASMPMTRRFGQHSLTVVAHFLRQMRLLIVRSSRHSLHTKSKRVESLRMLYLHLVCSPVIASVP